VQTSTRSWTTRRYEKKRPTQLISCWLPGPLLPREKLVQALEGAGSAWGSDGDRRRQFRTKLRAVLPCGLSVGEYDCTESSMMNAFMPKGFNTSTTSMPCSHLSLSSPDAHPNFSLFQAQH
jgi:hypothetical protein